MNPQITPGVQNLMRQGGIQQPAPQAPAGPSIASRVWGALNPVPVANAQGFMANPVGLAGPVNPDIGANINLAMQNVGAPGTGLPGAGLQPANGGDSFTSMFQSMTPQQQAAYAAANPGVDTMTGLPRATNLSPQNFNINPGGTFSSSSMNPTMTTQDALIAAAKARQALLSGKGDVGMVPSDGLYQSVIQGIFDSSQYSPQELQSLQLFSDTQKRIINTTLAARRQIKDLQESGAITKEQGKAFISEAARRSDAQLADLAAAQSGNTLDLQVLGLMRQNQLGAFQNIAGFLKPMEVSPGSSVINPITGERTYQGGGAAPATIMQTAMSLWQQAQTSGTATYNPDGTPDLQPFLAQAQQYYGGGGIGTYGQNGTPMAAPGATGGVPGSIPPQLQTYLTASGGQIINEDKVPENQKALIQQLAAQNGIPYLKAGDLDKYQSILVTQENLKNMEAVSDQILSSGLGGRTVGAAWNQISGALQLDPKIASFKAWRDTAVNTIQALAGGQGSGFRLNQAEIDLAASNLPTVTDNLETAKAKMSIINAMLGRWQNQILRGSPTAGAPGTGGPNVIQTKVGAVDNSWFQ